MTDSVKPAGGEILPASRPPRIAHYLPSVHLRDGGIVRAVLDWCALLAARGVGVTFIAGGRDGPDPPDIPPDWFDAGTGKPRAVLIEAPTRRLGRRALQAAGRVLDGIDVLHLHSPWWPGNRQMARLARDRGIPYLVTPHGMLDDWSMSQRSLKKRLYMGLFGRRFLDGAARVHCTAEAELAQASKWFSHARTAVLPLLFDSGPFRDLPGPGPALAAFAGLGRTGPKVLFLGRLHEKKGVDLLIRAAAELARRSRPLVLLIAGTGEADYRGQLTAMASEVGGGGAVEFLGHVGGTERVSLLQTADVLVLPTQQENFGLVLAEALACGTPVVTTRGVDIWREIESAGGVIVERSVGPLADALEDLLANPAAARGLGERGRRWVLEHLDPQRIGDAYERLYADAASRAGGTTGRSAP